MKHYYYEYSQGIDCTTIFASVVSSLVVGLIVGIIVANYGHKLWRKQYFYDKKMSTYFDLKVKIEKLVEPFITQNTTVILKKESLEIEAIIKSIQIQINTIRHFLGSSFVKDVDSLIYIMENPTEFSEKNFLESVKKAFEKIESFQDKLK